MALLSLFSMPVEKKLPERRPQETLALLESLSVRRGMWLNFLSCEKRNETEQIRGNYEFSEL